MTTIELPFRATTAQACHWLAQQTGKPWTLADIIGAGLMPYVWLDYDADHAALFGDANGGYPAPIFFEGDTRRLANGSDDVLITITKDVYKIVTKLPPPGLRRALDELRFLKKDLERTASAFKRAAEPAPVIDAMESQAGISGQQVLIAFSSLLRIDLEQALAGGGGIFGDEGARVKGQAKAGARKAAALWNPVTLALGLNDVHRVPMSHLKRAFNTHDFLNPWLGQWNQTLALLGK
jgi:hypothetical protein